MRLYALLVVAASRWGARAQRTQVATNATYLCGSLDRVGPPSEGGKYVCGLETLKKGCVVYSFGISGDSRFESHILDNTPCEVHAFDPTIPGLPHGSLAGIRFERTGLGVAAPGRGGALAAFGAKFPVAPLGALMVRRGHSNIDVLKVDVEGAEFEVFGAWCAGAEAFPAFDVLLIEVHAHNSLGGWQRGAGACLRKRGYRRFQNEQNLRGCACTKGGDVATEQAWIRVDSALARGDAYDPRKQEARHQKYLAVREGALRRLAQRDSPWRCTQGPAYFWDLFVPHHAALGGTAGRVETYDVSETPFRRVAAAIAGLEAEGWRVTRMHILPGQCTAKARRAGGPGPSRARLHFARLPAGLRDPLGRLPRTALRVGKDVTP